MKETIKRENKGKYHKLGELDKGVTIDENMDPHMLDDHPYFKAKYERFITFLETCSLEGLPEDIKKGLEEWRRELNAADKK